jgi:uroporphyrinogen decarboxylase
MNSRERILAAIAHQETDRVPLDIGGTRVTSIHPAPYGVLCRHLGMEELLPPQMMDMWQMLVWVDRGMADALGADCLPVPRLVMEFGLRLDSYRPWNLPEWTARGENMLVRMPANFQPEKQQDGSLLLYHCGEPAACMVPGSYYFDATIEASMRIEPPLLNEIILEDFSEEELKWRRTWAETLRRETDRFLIGDFGANLGRFGSYQEWLYHIAANPEFTLGWYEKKTAWLLKNVKRYYHAVQNNIDGIYLMEDFGTQNSMLVSPDMWRKMIKPFYKRLFSWIKDHTEWKIFFHSCGAVRPIIPDLIELGVDMLNPIQSSALGMEPSGLKRDFGDQITFWGAGVETQDVFPHGSAEEVRQQVRERLGIFRPGGGYVFGAGHNIQCDIPAENLIAFFEAYREFS